MLIYLNKLLDCVQWKFGKLLQISHHFRTVTYVRVVCIVPASYSNYKWVLYFYHIYSFRNSWMLSRLAGTCWQIVMAGNGTFQLWKSVSKPVMVGLVWNFSHRLMIMTTVATAPTVTQANHINLKQTWQTNAHTPNYCTSQRRVVHLPQCIWHHEELSVRRTVSIAHSNLFALICKLQCWFFYFCGAFGPFFSTLTS